MTTVTRRFEFPMGHALPRNAGPCAHLHGHHYVADVTVSAAELNADGMIVDFADLEHAASKFIDEELDHRFLIHRDDPRAEALLGLDATVMLVDWYPTAENLAEFVLRGVGDALNSGACVVDEVTLWETSDCSATIRRS